MLKKSLLITAVAASLVAAVPTQASANGDPVLGALVGAGIGAAIGHGVDGRHGAWVGGALGALTGASIAANSGGYYDGRYPGPSAAYYAPPPVYYQPAAVVYAPRPFYVRPYPYYARSYPVRPAVFVSSHEHRGNDWHDGGRFIHGPDNRGGFDQRGR